MTGRHWVGEAEAAFDQALASIPEGRFGTPMLWAIRAVVAAQLALAEQQRIGNLIAWKQHGAMLAAAGSVASGAPDALTDEIEAALGIEATVPQDPGGEL